MVVDEGVVAVGGEGGPVLRTLVCVVALEFFAVACNYGCGECGGAVFGLRTDAPATTAVGTYVEVVSSGRR